MATTAITPDQDAVEAEIFVAAPARTCLSGDHRSESAFPLVGPAPAFTRSRREPLTSGKAADSQVWV